MKEVKFVCTDEEPTCKAKVTLTQTDKGVEIYIDGMKIMRIDNTTRKLVILKSPGLTESRLLADCDNDFIRIVWQGDN